MPCRSGAVLVAGQEVRLSHVASARAAGLRFVPDDRHLEGIFKSLSVAENIALGQLEELASAGIVSRRRESAMAAASIADLRIRCSSAAAPLASLSGGNQQKVLLGREMGSEPKVLLVDEPTKGVDVGSRSDIYMRLRALAAAGVAVIVASSDGIELEGLCDRVLVFSRGSVTRELAGADVTDAEITAANLKSTAARDAHLAGDAVSRLTALARSIYLPALILAIVSAALVFGTSLASPRFITAYNLQIMLMFLGVLALASAAQLVTIVIGEIDLSVGPMAGLVVVLASFLIPDGGSVTGNWLGVALLLLLCAGIGLIPRW